MKLLPGAPAPDSGHQVGDLTHHPDEAHDRGKGHRLTRNPHHVAPLSSAFVLIVVFSFCSARKRAGSGADLEHERHEKHEKHEPALYRDEVFAIQGAVFEVSREMGIGFLEAVYQECLAHEFASRGIPFASQPPLMLCYKGQRLSQAYQPDFICYGSIIVELKVAREIVIEHRAQVLNYLRSTGPDWACWSILDPRQRRGSSD